MNKEQFYEFHASFTRNMLEVSRAKGADYTGSSQDPFANFKQVELLGICSTEQGFLARMTDKMSRVASLLNQEAQVKDESIEDTLKDLANYAILLAGYLRSKPQPLKPSFKEFLETSKQRLDISKYKAILPELEEEL